MSEVTVLVPSYNHAPFVERCLRSIFAQTLLPKKLIVIDDGSSDTSKEVIERVLADCPFPSEFVSRPNRGLTPTLNEGFAKVSTEFFAYLGSDDVWLPAFLESRVRLLEEDPAAVLAFGHTFIIDENEEIIDFTGFWKDYPGGDSREMLLKGRGIMSPSVLYRSRFLTNHSWNEDSYLEDYEMYLRLSGEGRFLFDECPAAAHRLHGTNVSNDRKRMVEEVCASLERTQGDLGLSDEELEIAQKRIKLDGAFQIIRQGDKRTALSWLWGARGEAISASAAGKLILRLVVPRKIFAMNFDRKERDRVSKLGNLRDYE